MTMTMNTIMIMAMVTRMRIEAREAVAPAQAGAQFRRRHDDANIAWVPACAGTTA